LRYQRQISREAETREHAPANLKPPGFQACPALRVARLARAFFRARKSTKKSDRKQFKATDGKKILIPPGIPLPRLSAPAAGRQQLYADGKFPELLARVDACLPKDAAGNFVVEQERSDVVHDLLAFLAERMLEMNKQKLARRSGFPGLEGYVGAKVEDLTPKTKLQSYYEHDYDGFLDVLKKNRKKLAIDPARREPAETLKAEFEGSLGKLGPLRERIERTDKLIDAVVYKLYGLTDEEIGIVEGKGR